MHGVWETQPYNSNIYMFCKINHLFIQFYKKLFVRVIVLRFAISKVVPNVFDIDENNSHDEDNTPVSNILLASYYCVKNHPLIKHSNEVRESLFI